MSGTKTDDEIIIEVHGDTGHGSRPDDIKVHVIYEAFRVVNTLQDYATSLGLGDDDVSVLSMTTGNNNSANQFPGVCTITVRFNNIDKMNHQKLLQFIKESTTVIRK